MPTSGSPPDAPDIARSDAADRVPVLIGIPARSTTAGTTSTSLRTGRVRLSSHSPNGSPIRTDGGPSTNRPRRVAVSG